MSERVEGGRVIHVPIVMALDCSAVLLSRCRKAATGRRLLVRACESAFAWKTAVSLQPSIIVLPSHLHEREPERFSMLAREAGSRLVVLESEQLPLDQLARMFSSALYSSAPVRAHASATD